jgi:hypothetical protein
MEEDDQGFGYPLNHTLQVVKKALALPGPFFMACIPADVFETYKLNNYGVVLHLD